MITTMPELYPGELIYDWFARYHKKSGNKTNEDTSIELFGIKSVCPNIYYPYNLEFFCNQLPKSWGYTPEYLINNHTVLPFYLPFMNEMQTKKVINYIKVGGSSQIKNYSGINADKTFESNIIKICPKCYMEDKSKYKEAYIHTIHQVQGCYICLTHMEYLISYTIPANLSRYRFVNINEIDINIDNIEEKTINDSLVSLTRDIYYVMGGGLCRYNIQQIKERYKDKLYLEDYSSYKDKLRPSKIINDFKNFYSKDFLEEYKAYDNKELGFNWIKIITTNKGRQVHPIHHILMINFLFGSIEKFKEYSNIARVNPFGNPKWPCLNYVCKFYRKKVIDNYMIDSTNAKVCGYFKCPFCGYIYERSGPDKQEDDIYKGKVVQYGYMWDKSLSVLVSNQYPVQSIAKLMGCCRKTVLLQSKRLGIADKLNTKSILIQEDSNKSNIRERLTIEECRNNVLALMVEHPEYQRINIVRALPYECRRLYREDREWLENNFPQCQKQKWTNEIGSNYIDWDKRDREISIKVLKAIEEILSELPHRRVSLRYLAIKIGNIMLIDKKYIDKMPITKKILNNSIESLMDFRKRKITYIVKTMVDRGEEVSKAKIRKYFSFKKDVYKILEGFIEETILKYVSGN